MAWPVLNEGLERETDELVGRDSGRKRNLGP
jgi:hypothetical protein